MIFSLVQDFTDALDAIPQEHPRYRILALFEVAIRRDMHFIDRHPTTLFQCLWNTCWWYDCPQAATHYVVPEGGWTNTNAPWLLNGPKLFPILEAWLRSKQDATREFRWLRSLRPPLLPLNASQIMVVRGHGDDVTSICYSPDGRWLASASNDQTVRLWDSAIGIEIIQLRGHTKRVTSICFSPDGRQIASASEDQTVRLWDLNSGAEVLQLRVRTTISGFAGIDFSPSVCISHDGQRLASVAQDQTFWVWDVTDGTELFCLRGCTEPSNETPYHFTSVCFSADDRYLATAFAENVIRVWDVNSQTEFLTLQGHSSEVTSVCFAPDGRRISSSDLNGIVRIWDASNGQELQQLQICNSRVRICFSPDGNQLAITSNDNAIHVWDLAKGAELFQLPTPFGVVTSICFSSDGKRLAAGLTDRTLRVWRTTIKDEVAQLKGHTNHIKNICFSPDGCWLATASFDHTARIWNAYQGTSPFELRHAGHVNSVCFSPDGQWVATASDDHTVRLWEVATGIEIRQLNGHTGEVLSARFSPDGSKLVSASPRERSVRVWNVATGEQIIELAGHRYVVTAHFSSDGQRITSWSLNCQEYEWDAATGECLAKRHSNIDHMADDFGNPDTIPWQACDTTLGVSFKDRNADAAFALFPKEFIHSVFIASPSGVLWAACGDCHLYLLTLDSILLPHHGMPTQT